MPGNLDLALRIRADTRQAARQIRQFRGDVGGVSTTAARGARAARRFGQAWATAGRSLGAARRSLISIRGLIAGVVVVASLRAITRAMTRQEDAIAQIERGVRNLGSATTLTSEGLQEIASGLQDVTTFGDEAVLELQALLLSFRRIDPSVFERTTEAALDLAVAIGQAPRDAALQLAKALEDPVQGLTALRRSGTVFSQSQTTLIRQLFETGREAEAQGLILDELERQYGGAARAARDTLGGALTALGNAFGDLLEGTGETQELRDAIEDLVTLLRDPATVAAAHSLAATLVDGFAEAVRLARELADLIRGNVTLDNAGLPVTPEQEEVLRQIRALADTDPIAAHRILGDLEDRLLVAAGRAEELRHELDTLSTTRVGGIAIDAALEDNIRVVEEQITRLRATIAAAEEILSGGGEPPPAAVPPPFEETPDTAEDDRVEAAERANAAIERDRRAHEDRLARIHLDAAEMLQRDRIERNRRIDELAEAGADPEAVAMARLVSDRLYFREFGRLQARAIAEANEARLEAHRDTIAEIDSQERSLDIGGAYDRAITDAHRWRDATLAALDETAEGYENLKARAEAVFIAMLEAAMETAREQARATRGAIGGIEQALDDYAMSAGDSFTQARDAATRAIGGMEDALVGFVRTGKLEFSSLVDSIIADIARIAIQQAITGPLANALLGAFSFGGTAGAPSPGLPGFGVAHAGGIAGSGTRRTRYGVQPAAFARAPRLHSGGLADDEVPTILRRGEGVFTPEQMRALGPAGPMRVDVRVESRGTPQEAEGDADAYFDGEALIIDVAVRDIKSGGRLGRTIEDLVPGAVL